MYKIREQPDGTVIEVAGEPTPEALTALCAPFGSLAGLDHAELLRWLVAAMEESTSALLLIADMLAEGKDGASVEWTPGRVSLITPTSSSRISLVHAATGERRPQLGIFLPARGAAYDAATAHDTSSGALTLLAELVALGQNPHVDGQPDMWAWSVCDRAARLVEALRARSVVRRVAICAALDAPAVAGVAGGAPIDDEADAIVAFDAAGLCYHHRCRYEGCGCDPLRPLTAEELAGDRRIHTAPEEREAARTEARRLIALANGDLGGCPGGPSECRAESPLCGPCAQARREEDELYEEARCVLAGIGETLEDLRDDDPSVARRRAVRSATKREIEEAERREPERAEASAQRQSEAAGRAACEDESHA